MRHVDAVRFVCIAGSLALGSTARGDDGGASRAKDAGSAKDDDVEEVHVRGQASAGGFESRAKLDDAPREITDAASLLEPLVGVHVRRLGADDGFATLSIRGSSSNEVAFYLAGVPLPAASDPTVDLSTLPLWPGAQVRVHRTFTPAALGPGSLGGTLEVDPPSPTGPQRTDVWMAGGSYGTLRARVGDISDLGGGARLATGLSASRSDGDFTFYNVAHNAPTNDPRAFIPDVNNDYAQASGLVSLFAPFRGGTVRATVMLQDREQGVSGNIYNPTPLARLRTDRELASVEIALPASRGVFGVQAWGVREGTTYSDACPTCLDPSLAVSNITSLGGAASYKARFGNVRLATKLDALGERFDPGAYVGPSPPTGATRGTLGAGADVEWQPTRAFTAAASARVDGWYDASDDPTLPTSFDGRPNVHTGIDTRLGIVDLALHSGYTARPANFVERFGSSGAIIPNPTLVPESAFTLDGGLRVAKRFGKHVSLEAEVDGFVQAARDLITFELEGARGIPKAYNVGSAKLEGVEAEVRFRAYGLELRVSYAGTHTENDDQCAPTCPPLPGRPENDLVADVSYALGPLRIRYGLDVLAGMTLDLPGTIQVPARALQQAGFVFDVPHLKGVRVTFDVRNLFDVRTAGYYQSFNGQTVPVPIGDVYYYPLPGRNVLLSVSWQPRYLAETRP
jgi:vitamin B12 transporter